jgi:hypothetical protein
VDVAGAVAADAGFIALMLVVRAPLVLRILTSGVFGWFAVVTMAAVLTRRVAFLVDAAGLTLGGSPFRYAATTRVFPWPEVDAVVVWRRDIRFGIFGGIRSPRLRLRCVGCSTGPGLRRRPDASPRCRRWRSRPEPWHHPV